MRKPSNKALQPTSLRSAAEPHSVIPTERDVTEQRITQIPVPGSSGQTPTGALQFQRDWPGLFIRGDDAIALLGSIREVEVLLMEHGKRLPVELEEVAEIIERDVIVK